MKKQNQALNSGLPDTVEVIAKYINITVICDRAPYSMSECHVIKDASEAFKCFKAHFTPLTFGVKEYFYLMALNRRNQLLGIYRVSEGGISGTLVDVRIIAKVLVDLQATSAIFCHNHPSGNLQPSAADITLTQSLKQMLSFHDIQFLDHLIITEDKFNSYHDWNIP